MYWVFLFFAIVTEIFGTIFMKYSSIHNIGFGNFVLCTTVVCSYILFSLAIKKISLSIAYALWEGIGIFIIMIFSKIFLNEDFSFIKIFGLIFLMLGIFMLKIGTYEKN